MNKYSWIKCFFRKYFAFTWLNISPLFPQKFMFALFFWSNYFCNFFSDIISFFFFILPISTSLLNNFQLKKVVLSGFFCQRLVFDPVDRSKASGTWIFNTGRTCYWLFSDAFIKTRWFLCWNWSYTTFIWIVYMIYMKRLFIPWLLHSDPRMFLYKTYKWGPLSLLSLLHFH